MDAANQARLQAITQKIHDTFPSLWLHFIERDKANQYYSVVFVFAEMNALNDDRFVMKGSLTISGRQTKQGYIEFRFQQQSYYRVNFYRSGSVRRICRLIPDDDYECTFKDLLSIITNSGKPEKDDDIIVDSHG